MLICIKAITHDKPLPIKRVYVCVSVCERERVLKHNTLLISDAYIWHCQSQHLQQIFAASFPYLGVNCWHTSKPIEHVSAEALQIFG